MFLNKKTAKLTGEPDAMKVARPVRWEPPRNLSEIR